MGAAYCALRQAHCEKPQKRGAGADVDGVSGCCEAELDNLTDRAVEALDAVACCLQQHADDLSPRELRTYMWARSSLAVVTGIRLDSLDL